MRIFIILFFIFLVGSYGNGLAEEKTNIGIIDSLVILSVKGAFESIEGIGTDSLAIDVSEVEREKGNYLKILVGNLAIEKSFKVFRNYNRTSSFQGLVFTINQLDIKIVIPALVPHSFKYQFDKD